ncbi:MAG: DegT/DnrJ/EryC1/StrS family aminotransferase [Verrucomicrobia bacterium]|nr:DegT/DnrJ/EryC1/StrS family aminotransferase [Verrucomicrobiota bacterium]
MIEFFDNRLQHRDLRAALHEALDRVVDSGHLILGPHVARFEQEFARWNGSAHAVGVANGTDALVIALKGLGIGPGDEVVTVANTAIPTVNAIRQAGAQPVFADIREDTWLIDAQDLARRITSRTRAVIPVHLYGNPADLPAILAVANRAGVPVIEDCAQAHGAGIGGTRVGNFGAAGCFSFYPTKNLGALGDAGLITTGDDALAEKIRRWRFYGYDAGRLSQEVGQNSRLDELQAAFLLEKLARLDGWIARRRDLAGIYRAALPEGVVGQQPTPGGTHAWHLFVVRARNRDALREKLHRRGVATAVHYPVPVFDHPAYRDLNQDLPVTRAVVCENVSLPLYPEMADEDARRAAAAVAECLAEESP